MVMGGGADARPTAHSDETAGARYAVSAAMLVSDDFLGHVYDAIANPRFGRVDLDENSAYKARAYSPGVVPTMRRKWRFSWL